MADAGYESEENYLFLEENGQTALIKPINYEIYKTRKYQKDIGWIENMEYSADKDAYTCKNGKELTLSHIRRLKSKTVTSQSKYTGGWIFWGIKVGYAIPEIFEQRNIKCVCRKHAFGDG